MEDKIKKKPKIKMYFIYGLVPDIIPLLLPNLDNILQIHLFVLFPVISFVIYFIQLELYGQWSENYISSISSSYNELTNKHKNLKIEYKKQSILITKHETISGRFIDNLHVLASNQKGKERKSIELIYKLYQNIKHDELGKYNRKDDI